MLKAFYKLILVSVLSGSLLNLSISTAAAQASLGVAGVAPTTTTTSPPPQNETLKTDGISSTNMMATLTMVAVGVIASRLYSYKMTPDIVLAAAGGAAFLAGDIIAFFKNKSVMKDLETEILRDDKGNLDQKQIESLEKLKQSYEAAKDTANSKKTLQMAAAAAFAAAGIVAYTTAATEAGLTGACMTAIGTAQAAMATCLGIATPAAAYPPTSVPAAATVTACSACAAALPIIQASYIAHLLGREALLPSLGGLTKSSTERAAINAKKIAGCEAPAPAMGTFPPAGATAVAAVTAARTACVPADAAEIVNESSGVPSLLITGLAAGTGLLSTMGIAASLAVTFVLMTSTTLSLKLDMMLLTPKKRAIIWGVLAALSLAASMAESSEIGKIESNIAKIDRILHGMYQLGGGVDQKNTPTPIVPNTPHVTPFNPNSPIIPVAKNPTIDFGSGGNTKLPCITGGDASKCSSFSSQFDDSLKNSGITNNLPPEVQGSFGDFKNFGDGINGSSKISGGTLGSAASLAAKALALNSALAKQQKALQSKVDANGSKENLAKQSADFAAELKAAVQKQLNASGSSASGMLASFGSGMGSGSGSGTDANSGLASGSNAKKDAAIGSGTAYNLNAGAAGLKDGFDADAKAAKDKLAADAQAALDAKNAAATANATSIDDYALKNDITQDKDQSIFELISNRYQKSGYPRLFKRIK